MFAIVLTLSADFLATVRALAAELPHVCIDTNRVQELAFNPEATEADVRRFAINYMATGKYEKVEIIHR